MEKRFATPNDSQDISSLDWFYFDQFNRTGYSN